ncbi:MAG: diacylglycerol kinase [Litoreibacter sp.]|nr:diacylglycerol kinase [Litoreibacter sp.]MCY4335236.1 diacylglycerol kinase [Litoreibacter sp.]
MNDLVTTEWQRFVNRCVWSWQGVAEVWRTEASFRYWTLINIFSATLVVAFPFSGAERGLIIALGILILAAEMLNSAIERAVDYTGKDIHPLAKAAKDAGSAGVALTACAGGLAWICILVS